MQTSNKKKSTMLIGLSAVLSPDAHPVAIEIPQRPASLGGTRTSARPPTSSTTTGLPTSHDALPTKSLLMISGRNPLKDLGTVPSVDRSLYVLPITANIIVTHDIDPTANPMWANRMTMRTLPEHRALNLNMVTSSIIDALDDYWTEMMSAAGMPAWSMRRTQRQLGQRVLHSSEPVTASNTPLAVRYPQFLDRLPQHPAFAHLDVVTFSHTTTNASGMHRRHPLIAIFNPSVIQNPACITDTKITVNVPGL